MKLFDKLFGKKNSDTDPKKYLNPEEIEEFNNNFALKTEQVNNIFIKALNLYNSEFCQCAFPRFQQISGIDCRDYGDSFKCFETDLLINAVRPFFYTEKSKLTDECINEKWVCKKCLSTYEYGWSDFSIGVEREKLKPENLAIKSHGLPSKKPIPLYIGLHGTHIPPGRKSRMLP